MSPRGNLVAVDVTDAQQVTDAVHTDLVEMLEAAWAPVAQRLRGLADEEYLWMPVAGAWTLHPRGDGLTGEADWEDPDPDPAPLTTIAWRMWHLAVDCFDNYSSRLFPARVTGFTERTFTMRADAAMDALSRSWANFAGGVAAWSPATLLSPLGSAWGPYSEATHLALAFHAQHELVHHGAELALLRDLYATRTP